ncbi:uncharacterized protein AruCF_2160 [Achromobacter ruhlandii]|nr:uncharacterized protein AruCF_2160 [Achromobacter ruhlandii]
MGSARAPAALLARPLNGAGEAVARTGRPRRVVGRPARPMRPRPAGASGHAPPRLRRSLGFRKRLRQPLLSRRTTAR